MDKTIVVLNSGEALEDRSWMCHTKGEAQRLAVWLMDNHIQALACTTEEWNKLNQEETNG